MHENPTSVKETQHKPPSLTKGSMNLSFFSKIEPPPPDRSNPPSDTEFIEPGVQKHMAVSHEGRVVEVAVYVCEARVHEVPGGAIGCGSEGGGRGGASRGRGGGIRWL